MQFNIKKTNLLLIRIKNLRIMIAKLKNLYNKYACLERENTRDWEASNLI